jgi:alkanesulfonate monooxygenase SsuD/methylene tetrahydromethanopterin reductase-like flavin-dependent oxidoreductase (luciferase family)
MVGANTFRNPGVVAHILTTLDHASGGRVIAGLGAAWFEPEHRAFGLDFGSGIADRLAWLEESVAALRSLFDGHAVSSAPGSHYRFRDLRLLPSPLQGRIPLLIGGSGERVTLRIVARYADAWNTMGPTDLLTRRLDVLRRHCDDVGRDPAEIELTISCKPIIRSSTEAA